MRDHLLIGDLKSFRDWGWAPDYVDAMERVINAERPDDFIIATGHGHSVAEMIQFAFEAIGVKDWENYTQIDSDYFRPNDIDQSVGNPQKARLELGWKHSRSLPEIMTALVAFDSALLNGEERHIAAQRSWKGSNPQTSNS
jgi:GDPmannose 4,6-dehydratase